MNMNIASKSPRRWHQGPGLPPAQSLGRLNSHWNHCRSEMFTEIFLSWCHPFFWDHVPMFTDCVHWRFLISCVPLLAVGCHGPQAFLRPSWWLSGTLRWDHRRPVTKKPRHKEGGNWGCCFLLPGRKSVEICWIMLDLSIFWDKKTAENRINMDKQRGRERKSSRP